MKVRLLLNILLFSVLLTIQTMYTGCQDTKTHTSLDKIFEYSDFETLSSVEYADGFDIYNYNGISKLVVYNPQTKDQILSTYYIMDSERKAEFSDAENIIQLPLDSVAVFSATQLNAFSKLDILSKVIAISESDYIRNSKVMEMYNDGKIVNLSSNGNFYLEKTLELNPKLMFYSPYNLAQKHPLAETNITMIPMFDFMETNPLGRAEWIKFTALFFGKDEEANLLFDTIVNSYNNYKSLTNNLNIRPTVFSDKYYSGQWFVPGGKSYIAMLFRDAGANYLWKDNDNVASFNLDFEVVFQKAHDADYWRIVGTYNDGFSYENLGKENELYKNFSAYNNHKVIFCDSKNSTYFETGTLEPHIILGDLIYAFHPELLPDYEPVYYRLYK